MGSLGKLREGGLKGETKHRRLHLMHMHISIHACTLYTQRKDIEENNENVSHSRTVKKSYRIYRITQVKEQMQ